jgi:hypothetical protein
MTVLPKLSIGDAVEPVDAAEAVPFGRWILLQAEHGGLIGQLAAAAKSVRAFPKEGDPTDVRKRLNLLGADPDMHEALDDAELDWQSC